MSGLTQNAMYYFASGGVLAAKLATHKPNGSAWIGVYNLTPKKNLSWNMFDFSKADYLLKIHRFVVPNEFLQNQWDLSDDIMLESERMKFESLSDLEHYLRKIGSSLAELQPASQTDYPL